jgi:hypothetical protein
MNRKDKEKSELLDIAADIRDVIDKKQKEMVYQPLFVSSMRRLTTKRNL